MNGKIHVIHEHSRLTREHWTFYFMESCMFLAVDTYQRESRQTPRHAWCRDGGKYDRIDHRESTISEEDVPLSADVVADALRQFFDQIRVGRWKDR